MKVIILLLLIIIGVGVVNGNIQEDVSSAPYYIESYSLHNFDCTDMSAIMETHLTEKGYDARIQVYTGSGVVGHAMVIVYDHTKYTCVLVESTRKRTTTQTPQGMKLEGEYNNIVDAVENSRWGASEWGLDLYLSKR